MSDAPAPPRTAQPLILGTLAALVALFAAGVGLLFPGLYSPSTPAELLPGAASQDIMTLAVAAGALALVPRLRRGSTRGWAVWLGLMGYLVYAYALYAFERTYNPVFLCYIAVLGLSLWAILTAFAAGAPLGLAPADPKKPPPRRSTAIHLGLMIVMFAGLWLSILLPSMATRVPPDGNAIFVQDLAFVLPLLAVTARLLWLGRPMGDLLAVPVLVKMATLGLSVLLGTLIAPLYGQPLKPADVAVYAALGAVPLAILPIFLSRLRAVSGKSSTAALPLGA
jgi:hypothetical protein